MTSRLEGRNRNDREMKIHLPSFWWNVVLLKILPFTYVVALVVVTFAFVEENDWSLNSIILQLLIILFLSAIILFPSLIIFIIANKSDTFISAKNGTLLIIKKRQIIRKYDLGLISSFIIVSTSSSVTGGVVVKNQLFFIDRKGEKTLVYEDDMSKFRRTWKKVGECLEAITSKNVIFKYFVEDSDGEILEPEDYYRKLVRKKVSFFD